MKGTQIFLALILFEALCAGAQSTVDDQTKARTALSFEISQIGTDCRDAKTTAATDSCLATVEQKSRRDFTDFFGSLQDLLRGDPAALRQLDASQAEWERYRQTACDAIDYFFLDGTIRISAVTRCRIQLTRSRRQDLNMLYYTTLHN